MRHNIAEGNARRRRVFWMGMINSNHERSRLGLPVPRSAAQMAGAALLAALLLAPGFLELRSGMPLHPHGFCYLWQPGLVALHVGSDTLIGLSYLVISATLAYLLYRGRRALPFSWVFLAFGTFIVACGATHLMEVWTLWHATYWLSGDVKLITAFASVATAVALPPLVPKVLGLLELQRTSETRRCELEAAHGELTRLYDAMRQARDVLQQELATHTQDITALAEEIARQKRDLQSVLAERQQAAGALRRSEAQLKAIIGSATDAIITIDQAQRITVFNSGAEEMFGCGAESAIGQPLERFIPARYRERHRAYIEAFGATGVTARAMGRQRELAALRADGSEFPMEAQISQITVGGEKLYTVILRDITERKRAEMQRERLLASEQAARLDAEAASRAKDAFLATVSHELRTPLSPILAWSHMLRHGQMEAGRAQQAVEAIERNAKSQAQLIEDLLDVSRIVAGKMHLNIQPVRLEHVISAAVEVVRPAAEAKSVELHCVLDSRPGTIAGDPDRLQQVVWNLLSNAIKFTPKGGHVQLVLRPVNSHVEIVVSDTGQGIGLEFLPHVFERFRQADSTSTRVHGGLGLGLAIVRHIIELHGGSVHVESAGEGRGSTFTVKLPVASATMRTLGDSPRRHPRIDPHVTQHTYPRLDQLRVLLVDDEADSNEVVRVLLTSCGAEVRTAASVAQAFEVLAAWKPDVVVSDIGMAEEDGYALIAKLRAGADGLKDLPVIALTAYASVDDRVRLLSAGFQMHVTKPVEPIELVTVVANVGRMVRKA